MKKILVLFTILSLAACKSKNEKEVSTEETTTEEVITVPVSNDMNTQIMDPEEEGAFMLLGKIDRTGLQKAIFKDWYTENTTAHVLDSAALKLMKPFLNEVSIKVFMGTWCEDSQREIPALFKILDAVNYSKPIEMVAVSRDKDTPQGYEEGYNIEYVPTIIFMKDGKEMNRIVEYAQETLERDIFRIIKGAPYKHAYAE